MRAFLQIILIGLIACTAACSFQKDGSNNEPVAPTVSDLAEELEKKRKEKRSNEVIAESDFAFLVEEGKLANSYFIAVNFPVKDGVRIFISQDGKQLPPKITPGTRIPVEGGEKVLFSVTAYSSSEELLLNFTKEIQIPKDLVISEFVSLKQDLTEKIGRFIIKDDAILKTNGKLVSIEADKVIVGPNSKIINFSEEDFIGNDGNPSGGSVSIRAKTAVGFLIISMRGARGKDGLSGLQIRSIKGYELTSQWDGNDGQDGVSTFEEVCREKRPERGGGESCRRDNERCTSPATNGENGAQGPSGEDGENGGHGGDTGNVFIQIEDYTNFSLNLSMIPGSPGSHGVGAPGYPGGQGGRAGQQDADGICPGASAGVQGPSGPNGKDGQTGAAGKVGTYELNGLRNVQLQLPSL